MEFLIEVFQDEWEALVRLSPRIGIALLVVVVAYLVGRLVGKLLVRILRRRRSSLPHVAFFGHMTTAAFMTFGIVIGLGLVGLERVAAGLLTSGGLVAVVVAFAFRGIGENLLSGLFLAFSCPFEVGNYIASGEFEGEVRSVELRFTHIRTPDGRDVYIPNAQIFNAALVNFTRDGLRRFDCRIGIDYHSDVPRALTTMATEVAGVEDVIAEPAPLARLRELSAATAELSVLYWVDVFAARRHWLTIQSDCNDRVREALIAAGFTVSGYVSTAIDVRTPDGLRVAS